MAKKASTRKRAPKSAEQEPELDNEKPHVDAVVEAEQDREALIREIELAPKKEHNNLYSALIAAQKNIKFIMRDAKHDKFGWYTSGENMVAVSRAVLHHEGLAVMHVGDRVEQFEGEFIKHNEYLLVHDSGQTQAGSMSVPIEVTKNRSGETKGTLQDATLKADTIALSYYLRGVLQLPRYDQEKHQVAAEPQYFKPPQPGSSPPAPVSSAPAATPACAPADLATTGSSETQSPERVSAVMAKIKAIGANLPGILQKYGVSDLAFLSDKAYNHLDKGLDTVLAATKLADTFNAERPGSAVVTKVTTTPAPQPEGRSVPEGAPEAVQQQGQAQLLQSVQVNIVKGALAKAGKTEEELLTQFAYASVEEIELARLTEVMAWIRK